VADAAQAAREALARELGSNRLQWDRVPANEDINDISGGS